MGIIMIIGVVSASTRDDADVDECCSHVSSYPLRRSAGSASRPFRARRSSVDTARNDPSGINDSDASHWYYFDNYTGATTYGYKCISDPTEGYWGVKTVFNDKSMGWMLYGWQNISGTWYYFNRYTTISIYSDVRF